MLSCSSSSFIVAFCMRFACADILLYCSRCVGAFIVINLLRSMKYSPGLSTYRLYTVFPVNSSVIVIRVAFSDTVRPFVAIAYIDIRVAGALGMIATSSSMSPIHVYVYAVCTAPCPNFIDIGFSYVYVGRFILFIVSVLVMCMSVPLSAIAVSVVTFVMRSFVKIDCCWLSALLLCVFCSVLDV